VVGLISDNDESAYREVVKHLAAWCADNNLALNAKKTKELIVDYRKSKSCSHSPVLIDGTEVERVPNFIYLGVNIFEVLYWTLNTSTLVKKAQQRLYFLRRLKKARLFPKILVNFYLCTVESILTNCATVWFGGCSLVDRKALQRVVKTAQHITGVRLPAIVDLKRKRRLHRACGILRDPSHPCHKLCALLPSGRWYRSLRCRTSRLKNSFFPATVTLLNTVTAISTRPHLSTASRRPCCTTLFALFTVLLDSDIALQSLYKGHYSVVHAYLGKPHCCSPCISVACLLALSYIPLNIIHCT
jgi:hypothetical protein